MCQITARSKRRQGLGTELDDHRWGPVLKQPCTEKPACHPFRFSHLSNSL